VSRDEPGCFEVVLFEELKEAADTDGACEETWSGGLEVEGREGGKREEKYLDLCHWRSLLRRSCQASPLLRRCRLRSRRERVSWAL
jgi:hypothetical protein